MILFTRNLANLPNTGVLIKSYRLNQLSFGLFTFLILDYFEYRLTISVRSGMFMPKPDDVAQFVDNDAFFVTILADRDGLRFILAPASDVGAATREGKLKEKKLSTLRKSTRLQQIT